MRARRLPVFYGWVGRGCRLRHHGARRERAHRLLSLPSVDPRRVRWPRSLTAGAFSVGFLVSAAISPSLGWLVDRYGPRVVIEIGVGLLASGSPTLLYIMVGSQGMLGYSLTSVIGAIPAEIFEGRQFGAIYGTLMLAAIGGGALGPWVTGAFYDATAARFAVRSRRQRS